MKIYRIARWAFLLVSILSIFLLFKKPKPVAEPQPPAVVAANVQSFQTKLEQLERADEQRQTGAEVHLNADEINAAAVQAAGTIPPATGQVMPAGASLPSGSAIDQQPTVKDYQFGLEGNVIRGQFLTELAGKNIYVTLAGHLGSKDGYATFEPTEFKVGDLAVPVSLVNDAFQKKLAEQRDRLKLPDYVGDIKIENSELILKQK